MKVIVFGATGGTGKQLIDQALELGHEVTAFARQPALTNHKRLTWFAGDVLDPSSVMNAVKGHDAVLCALGAPAFNKHNIRSIGTRNIINAMHKNGVERLICQSALGCQDSYDLLPLSYKYLIIPLMLRHVYADHTSQEAEIEKSQLNWSIVRPSALVDQKAGKKKKNKKIWFGTSQSEAPKLSMKITRKDVADFMLKQLSSDAFLKQAVNLSC